MPFEDNIGVENPVKKYIVYKGSVGKFYYYDKEQEKDIELPKNWKFYVIDTVNKISGYHEKSESSIYSNEVRNSKKEPFKVRSYKSGEIVYGIYDDIKGNLEGGKYSKSIYALYNGEVVNITLAGVAMSEYIDANLSKVRTISVGIDPEKRKKGTNVYYAPTFEHGKPVASETTGRDEHQQAVSEYLNSKLSLDATEAVAMEEVEIQSAPLQTYEDDLPF